MNNCNITYRYVNSYLLKWVKKIEINISKD
jgi:hypothetical protein